MSGDRKQKMSLPGSEKTAGGNFQHLHLALVPIDKQIADMADFFAMSIVVLKSGRKEFGSW